MLKYSGAMAPLPEIWNSRASHEEREAIRIDVLVKTNFKQLLIDKPFTLTCVLPEVDHATLRP